MNKHLRYAGYILRHKWFVFVECAKRGLWWRGLMHDMSKLRPSEWTPYVNYFYRETVCSECVGEKRTKEKAYGDMKNVYLQGFYWVRCGTCNGRGTVPRDRPTIEDAIAFDLSWLHHQHRNPHHWQYWVLKQDDGTTRVLPMPEPYRTEMLCDWLGAGRAITGKVGVNGWYKTARHLMKLHPQTKAWVEMMLEELP